MADFLRYETALADAQTVKTYQIGSETDTHLSSRHYDIRVSGIGYDMLASNPGIVTSIIDNQVETTPLGRGNEATAGYFYANSPNGERRYVLRKVFDPHGIPATATHTAYLLLAQAGIETVTPCFSMHSKSGPNFNIYLCGDPIYPNVEEYIRRLFMEDPTSLDGIRQDIHVIMKRTQHVAEQVLNSLHAHNMLRIWNYKIDLYEGWVDQEQKGMKYDNYLVVSDNPLNLMVIDPLAKRFYKPEIFGPGEDFAT